MAIKWIKTQFPGVRYRENPLKRYNGKPDRYFTIRYKFNGILKEEGLGWASHGWNAQKASIERNELVKGQKTGDGPTSLAEKRKLKKNKEDQNKLQAELAVKENVIFEEYFTNTYSLNTNTNKSPKAIECEEVLLRLWIGPVIGKLGLKEIGKVHLEKIIKEMFEAGKSARYIRYALAVVRQVFNYARFTNFYIGPSPIENVKFPQADNKRLRFLTIEEATLLLKELKERSHQLYEIALVSLRTGARADEVFTLKWGDLDYKNNLMTLWDTKNTKTRLARMTPDIKKMFIDKRAPDFSPEEFQVRQSARKLYKAVKKDFPGFLADIKEPIPWLNTLLKGVSLHEHFLKIQPKSSYSEIITELIKMVKAYSNKPYDELKDIEKESLKRLNRLLIEETYPLLTPKNSAKTTRNNNDYIFPDRNGKKIIVVSRAFERTVDEIGLNKDITDNRMKVVFHTLRHTYASWLVEKGVDLYVVMQLMGHSSLKMTERYSHVGENALSAAVRKLGKIEINIDQELPEEKSEA